MRDRRGMRSLWRGIRRGRGIFGLFMRIVVCRDGMHACGVLVGEGWWGRGRGEFGIGRDGYDLALAL